MQKNYILLDIGGTSAKYAMGDIGGKLWNEGIQPALSGEGASQMVLRLVKLIESLRDADTDGVTISTAGVVEPEQGKILQSCNIPGYTGFPLADFIQQETGLFCTVENDVNCMALGELWKGAASSLELTPGADPSTIFCMAVGTGIGGAVINGGRVLAGASCCGGEIGFLPMGNGQTLEDIASVGALLSHLEKAKGMEKGSINGKKVFEMLESGDIEVRTALDDMIEGLAQGLAGAACILDPAYIVVGGAMLSSRREYFQPRLQEAWRRYLPTELFQETELVFSQLGNKAQLYGALKNHLDRKGSGREKK